MLFTSVGPFLVFVYAVIDIILTIQIATVAKRWGGPVAGYVIVGLLFSFVPILVALVCRVASKLPLPSELEKPEKSSAVDASATSTSPKNEVDGIVAKEDF